MGEGKKACRDPRHICDDRGRMEDGKKNGPPPVQSRMTCLIWAILIAVILFAARMCALLVSSIGGR